MHPLGIYLWIFVSAKRFPPAINSTLHVFMVFSIKNSSSIFLQFEAVYYPDLWDHILCLFWSQSRPWLDFSVWSCFHWSCPDKCRVFLLCSILYVPPNTICGLLGRNKFNCFFLFAPICSSIFLLFYYFVVFLFAFPVEFPIPVFISYSCFLREPRFSHELFFLLHWLVHLIWIYYLLIYLLVLDFFLFLSWLFSNSVFLSDTPFDVFFLHQR